MTYCQRPESLGLLAKASEDVFGTRIQFKFYTDRSAPAPTFGRSGSARRPEDNRLRPKVVEDDPFVQQAIGIFGGTVVDVRKVLDAPATTTAETDPDSDADEPPPLTTSDPDDADD